MPEAASVAASSFALALAVVERLPVAGFGATSWVALVDVAALFAREDVFALPEELVFALVVRLRGAIAVEVSVASGPGSGVGSGATSGDVGGSGAISGSTSGITGFRGTAGPSLATPSFRRALRRE